MLEICNRGCATLSRKRFKIKDVSTNARRASRQRKAIDGEDPRARNLIPGGKSLSGDGTHSPLIKTRVPKDIKDRLVAIAKRDGITESRLIRLAVTDYLDRENG
jgi:hypothetical protein